MAAPPPSSTPPDCAAGVRLPSESNAASPTALNKEAQKKGAKVVVIDSYASKTAKEADWYIGPKPGTDGALAMAMIHTII
jgi:anaerobic selenocysteine-containing dehydrogenase